jgi:parallel beta helix pectate lyase-like protein
MRLNMRVFALATFAFAATLPLSAAVQRTFVASTGLDTNNCQRPTPCRNFTAALAQTSPGGEVVVLDSAGYGPIPAITQSVSIIAPLGVHAAMTVMSGTGITINAPGGSVVLRNLFISSLGGAIGINIQDSSTLDMDHLFITGFSSYGIFFLPASSGELALVDCVIRKTLSDGVFIGASTPNFAHVMVTRSRFADNFIGLHVVLNSRVTVRDSAAFGNTSGGFVVDTVSTDSSRLQLEGCTVAHNGTGINATAGAASVSVIHVSNTVISGNTTGVAFTAPASVLTRTNNTLADNTADGAFSGNYFAQ